MTRGTIFDIREFTVHDGPGLRTTVFFKGCTLRCAWCHNPEGMSLQPELMVRQQECRQCGSCWRPCVHEACKPFGRCHKACPLGLIRLAGETVAADTLAARLLRSQDILRANGGGVTISGGEPLAQPDFLLDLLELLCPIHTVVETSGHGPQDVFLRVAERVDLFLFDIKIVDPLLHQKWTGIDNRLILSNLHLLIRSGKSFIARIPLIPGVNDTVENLESTARLLSNAPGLVGVELLPYNPFAGAKYPLVGKTYDPGFDESIAPRTEVTAFRDLGIPAVVL